MQVGRTDLVRSSQALATLLHCHARPMAPTLSQDGSQAFPNRSVSQAGEWQKRTLPGICTLQFCILRISRPHPITTLQGQRDGKRRALFWATIC